MEEVIFLSIPLLSQRATTEEPLLLSTFNFLIVTHHLGLIYIILLFILQLSQSIRLHVHFFPSLVSLCVVLTLF